MPHRTSGRAVLELRNVDAGYGPFRALFDVSLAVRPGSVTALLGANGAGKTTVARVATGLIRPTKGEVWFDGRRIAWPRRTNVAFWEKWFTPAAWADRRGVARSRSRGSASSTRPKADRCSRP